MDSHLLSPLSLRFYLFGSISSVVFLTFIYKSHLTFLLCLWSMVIGSMMGYLVLSTWPMVPSLLLFTKRKPAIRKEPVSSGCGICGNENCQRHRRDVTNASPEPWNKVLIPESVDKAIAEFFELVLRDFVYVWYRDLTTNEAVVDEIRSSLRHMVAILVQRASKVDISQFVTGKLAQAGVAHIHVYLQAKRKHPHRRDQALADVVLQEYGDALFPYLLPSTALRCKSLVGFLRELWAHKLLTMACDTIINPDFVNKIILELLAPAKPIVPLARPSRSVPIMSSFVRSTVSHSTLQLPLSDLLTSDGALFPFMQFMKTEGTTGVLQFCLALEDLTRRSVRDDLSDEECRSLLNEAKTLYETYFAPNAWDKILMDQQIVNDLQTAVEAYNADNPKEGLRRLKQSTPLIKAYEYVNKLLENTYSPLFHHSDTYYEHLCGSRLPAYAPKVSIKKKEKRNRVLQPFKRLHSKLKDKLQDSKDGKAFIDVDDDYEHCQVPSPMPSDDDILDDDRVEPIEQSSPQVDMSKWNVKIIIASLEGRGTNQSLKCSIAVDTSGVSSADETHFQWALFRRWKEFRSLDSQLRSFHDHIQHIRLPPKGFTLLMSRERVDKKKAELETYLRTLVGDSVLKGSQLLYSFLTPDTEEYNSKFAVRTVGDKAGKMIKSVQQKLKKERGQHLETFLTSFLQSIETVRPHPTEEMVAEWNAEHEKCAIARKQYEMEVCDPGPVGKRYWEEHNKMTDKNDDEESFRLDGVADIVLYLVREVWCVPSWLHHVLYCAKLLGQNTFEAFLDSFLCGKMDIILREDYLVDIIHLLRDTLFFDKDPPRTSDQIRERSIETLEELIKYPPHIVAKLLGDENYREGMTTIFEALQHPELNQHLFFILLDMIVKEVFPEVDKDSQHQ
ncbi:sorting nexin-14-like isoform X2 [Corticium candelabrum]|uniref:sorting nexin-14-like isoform X2 n=1 Tax=Corticium candelabrum TaxID=121492 RepID=UPI002E2F2071|nr:sorting nexin-14-like isoform X2 [Corticium candelabrum]